MTEAPFYDRPPFTDRVNAYDELFGLDPAQEPCRAKIVHESHLARARWMTETGYQHLLEPRVR
jgi:hypothetical protein